MNEIRIKNVDETIYEHTCSNGLKVYIWPYSLSEEISFTLTVKYGSIHTKFKSQGKEINVPNGMAHFLEHIKFNEKKDVTAHDYFYKNGSYTNAYTTYDHTCYEVTCTKNIKDNLEHLLYFVLNPYFTKSLIQKEKPIIIEESKMTLNDPYNMGYKKLMENCYVNSNRKYLITGEEKDIKSISIEDVENIFYNFYHPQNMFLVVTGNVNQYEIEKIVNDFFKDKDYGDYLNPEIILKKEPNKVIKKYDEINTNVMKDKLLIAYKISKDNYKKYDDLHLRLLFNSLFDLNFGSTSDFYEELINNQLVDEFYYMVSVEEDHIVLLFEISTDYHKVIIDKIESKMHNLSANKEDFERKKKILIASSILGFEDANDVNNQIKFNIIRYGNVIDNVQEIYQDLCLDDCIKIKNNLKGYNCSIMILKTTN